MHRPIAVGQRASRRDQNVHAHTNAHTHTHTHTRTHAHTVLLPMRANLREHTPDSRRLSINTIRRRSKRASLRTEKEGRVLFRALHILRKESWEGLNPHLEKENASNRSAMSFFESGHGASTKQNFRAACMSKQAWGPFTTPSKGINSESRTPDSCDCVRPCRFSLSVWNHESGCV